MHKTYANNSQPVNNQYIDLYTNIELDYPDDYHQPTEIKITCSDNDNLKKYLTDLCIYLWKNLGYWEVNRSRFKLPKSRGAPLFTSLVDYYRQHGVPDQAPSPNHPRPWEQIPNHFWDRTAVQMWHEGYTNSEISKKVNVSKESVTNRICELRKEYSEDIVPKKAEIRRRLIINS